MRDYSLRYKMNKPNKLDMFTYMLTNFILTKEQKELVKQCGKLEEKKGVKRK